MVSTANALAGQVAVVTGAGRGIGAAIAQKLASMGAWVAVCGRTKGPLDATVRAIAENGHQAQAMVCDVQESRSVGQVAQAVRDKQGRIDILVNNAGVGGFASLLHELPVDDWDRILNTNLRGVFYAIRAFAPLMIE